MFGITTTLSTPENAAKWAAIISLAIGSATALLPASSLVVMGLPTTPRLQTSMRRLGTSLLSFGLLNYGLVAKNYTKNQSVALGCIPWIVDFITVLVMDNENKKGHPMKAEFVGLLSTLFTSYVTYKEAGHMQLALTVNAGWLFAFGLIFRYAPAPNSSSPKINQAFKFLDTLLGSCLLGLAFCETALAFDAGAMKSVAGGTALFALGGCNDFIGRKEVQ